MNQLKKVALISLFVAVIEIVASIHNLPKLPDQIPNYVNSHGELVNWGSKWLIFWAPTVTLGLICLMYLPFHFDTLKENFMRSTKYVAFFYSIGTIIIAIFYVQIMVISMKTGDLMFSKNTYSIFGLALIAIGNRLPSTKRNWFSGIPTPWAMKSDEIWLSTHRFAGWVFIMDGVVVLFSPLMSHFSRGKFIILLTLIGFVMVFIYSYVIYKMSGTNENIENNENP